MTCTSQRCDVQRSSVIPVRQALQILIVRLDGVGDALLLLPLLVALEAAGHRLGIVLSPQNAGIYRSTKIREYIYDPHDNQRCLAQLKEAGYDMALIATEKPVGYRIAVAAGIAKRIGFWNGLGKPFKSLWIATQTTQRRYRAVGDASRHEVATLFDLGIGLHDEPEPTRDLARLRPWLLAQEPAPTANVVLQVTTRWLPWSDAARLAVLARSVSAAYSCLLVGAAVEEAFLAEVEAASGLAVRRMRSFEPWLATIAGARALVTPDTGAAHAAGMLGTPLVDIFAPSATANMRRRWQPWAASTWILPYAGESATELSTKSLTGLNTILASPTP